MNILRQLWREERGFVVSSELVLGAGLLVIGMTVGMVNLRDQVLQEFRDVAGAISDLNQSYSFSGVTGHSASTAGSFFSDLQDFCDPIGDPARLFPNCVDVTTMPASPEL